MAGDRSGATIGAMRYLQGAVERAVSSSSTDPLQPAGVRPEIAPATAGAGYVVPLAVLEREAIRRALAVTGHNVSQAARALGISRATLHRKLNKLNLRRRSPA